LPQHRRETVVVAGVVPDHAMSHNGGAETGRLLQD
jgi:hypothetical protein